MKRLHAVHHPRHLKPYPFTDLGEELPLILFNKDLDARLQFLDIILLEQTHVAFDPIIVVNTFFLHHPVVSLISSDQH